ncbi:LCP family protein [Catenulispora subtropica]|uniref:LCP family protein n=1 Tax=Catenulispora subtropica TaxID=450798 RepID=A0ABN2QYY3_9ACTN
MSGDTPGIAEVPKHAPDAGPDGGGPALGGTAPVRVARRRARRILMVLSGMMVLVIGSTVAYAGYWYYRINHNIKGAPLHGAVVPPEQLASGGVIQPTPDAYGNLPINILLIGTDTRLPGKDADLGGFVDASGRADVEMLVHVSADRSNATVVSLPRDLMVPIPECVDAKGDHYGAQNVGMINSALAAGPGCQVDTVEMFTHVKIDHFMMVDFSGVVDLTNAVGGVDVCVTKAVHDPDSHLDLPAGTSQVEGTQALAFLRTREGFADGSDLYRTQAQHQYLGSLIRKMKSQATLDDPLQATHLMDIASKSLTVDDPIASVNKLLDLSNTLKKVPTENITFLTLPTVAYRPDPNRVAPDQELDDQIFSLIAHDRSVTEPSSQSGPASPTTGGPTVSQPAKPTGSGAPTSLAPSAVKDAIVVENGTTADGRSKQLAETLRADGFKNATGVGYSSSDVAITEVFYSKDQYEGAAQAVAAALQLPPGSVRPGGDGSAPVVLRVGADFASGDVFNPAAPTSPPPSALPSDAASSADVESAGDQNLCVTAAH